jgi:hypothetical protein
MHFLIEGHHPPDLCPTSNESIRKLAAEASSGMASLGEKLGVKVTATYVPVTNHKIFVAVEAEDVDAVREFVFQGRLSQWNTVEIYLVSTLGDAIGNAQKLPAVY